MVVNVVHSYLRTPPTRLWRPSLHFSLQWVGIWFSEQPHGFSAPCLARTSVPPPLPYPGPTSGQVVAFLWCCHPCCLLAPCLPPLCLNPPGTKSCAFRPICVWLQQEHSLIGGFQPVPPFPVSYTLQMQIHNAQKRTTKQPAYQLCNCRSQARHGL